jgi:Tetracyclin repressor-like, C-terminal domain
VLRVGIKAGDFRNVDPAHVVSSMVAMVIFYFSSAPMMQRIVGFNPLAPERIAARRTALLDFIAAGLFAGKPNTTEGARP